MRTDNEELGLSQTPSTSDGSRDQQIKTLTPASSRRFLRSKLEQTEDKGGLLGVSNANKCLDTIISIVEDPIQCGYFRNFCESEQCLSHISFLLEVIRFRQFIKSEDLSSWTLSWDDMDDIDPEDYPSDYWPQNSPLQKEAAEGEAQRLWIDYLRKSAEKRVVLPEDIFDRTKERIRNLGLYGSEVFGEAVEIILIGLTKNVLPPFLISPICTDMVVRLDTMLGSLSTKYDKQTKVPTSSIILTNDSLDESRRFSLYEILNDRMLYFEFYQRLSNDGTCHNLLCYQAILEYEDDMEAMSTSKDLTKAWNSCVALAWNIFRHFVADGAPFEVRMTAWTKYEIMLMLAKPTKILYAKLKSLVLRYLTLQFNAFTQTDGYAHLVDTLRFEKNKALESTRISWAGLLRIWRFIVY